MALRQTVEKIEPEKGITMIRWILAMLGIATLAGTLLILRSASPGRAEEPSAREQTGRGVAVVELFTSEGCSSCPPADELLSEMVKDTEGHNQRVFCLAFHVDYWNRLGWADPNSDVAFSRRQQDYASALKLNQVYTPQMVVNGSTELVGSDRKLARQAIERALRQPTRATVKVRQETRKDTGSLLLAYEVGQAARGNVLNLAVVERGLVSKVKRGENGGRTLRHENVVRVFKTIRLDEGSNGIVELKLPADLVLKNSSAIAYIQDSNTWAVLGASAIELQPASPGL
jgi:hypothetical protein